MVGLPVLVLTSGVALMSTSDISMSESVPGVMGSAQARIHPGGSSGRQIQSPDGTLTVDGDGGGSIVAALPVPGFAADSPWSSAKIQKLTGGRLIPMVDGWMRVTLSDRRPTMMALGIDARDPMARGMTDLVSGRWAGTTSEIVVTEAGIAGGLPNHGTLTTTDSGGKPRLLTVVGVTTALAHDGILPLLVGLPDLLSEGAPASAFLLDRAYPVSWPDVRTMNEHGLVIQSREVFLFPPSRAELDPRVAQTVNAAQDQSDLILLMAALGLFIETTLLAGPAFAVSAARQRRSLALAASNGAEARQLRRYVLGQAVVLGAVSAAIAVVAGVFATWAGLGWLLRRHADYVMGPFEVSWPRVVGVFVCAVLASVVAALLPAKGVARLDIVSVLAGRAGSRTLHRGLPVAGGAVMVLSTSAIAWGVASGGEGGIGRREYLMVGGTVGLVLGALMVIPVLLALVGRIGAHLVLPLRVAVRDTARQRGRSTPAVAAIMAAVAALTALSIGAVSSNQKNEDDYRPQRAMGTGVIEFMSPEVGGERKVGAVLDRFAPQVRIDPVAYLGGTPAIATDSKVSWVNLVLPGCTESQILASYVKPDPHGAAASCQNLDNQPVQHVGTLSGLLAKLPLSLAQRKALEDGGMLITDPSPVKDGRVSVVSGMATLHPSGVYTRASVTERTHVPAVMVDPQVWAKAFPGEPFGSWILQDTATRHGWTVQVTGLNLNSPTGTITAQEERAVADRLGDGYTMYVERGYQNPYWRILLIAFSVTGLLVLIASLISTALSLAESQNDMATLAAVGATRHTRRGIAASQAWVVAACGCLLGVAVGMVPGIAVTWPLTTRGSLPPTIAIPWLPLVAVCVGVPLLAAGLAWSAVRRHPQMTRRLA